MWHPNLFTIRRRRPCITHRPGPCITPPRLTTRSHRAITTAIAGTTTANAGTIMAIGIVVTGMTVVGVATTGIVDFAPVGWLSLAMTAWFGPG